MTEIAKKMSWSVFKPCAGAKRESIDKLYFNRGEESRTRILDSGDNIPSFSESAIEDLDDPMSTTY